MRGFSWLRCLGDTMQVGDKTNDDYFVVLLLSREEITKESKVPLSDDQIANLCRKISSAIWDLTGQDTVDEVIRIYTEDM